MVVIERGPGGEGVDGVSGDWRNRAAAASTIAHPDFHFGVGALYRVPSNEGWGVHKHILLFFEIRVSQSFCRLLQNIEQLLQARHL